MSITANATDQEKVQLIFKYLQSSTRYVSIQLGIGGFQPMPALEVEKNGYGDCKALSNYMKAMLKAVGIHSVYAVISTNRANIDTEFTSLGQMDHVILAVPMKSDTLWLECTNPLLSFNYAHEDIAGHQCLFITPEGGVIHTVKRYPDIENSQSVSMRINVNEKGNASASIKTDYKLAAYEYMLDFMHSMSRDEQINWLNKNLKINKAKITNLQTRMNDSEYPDISLMYDMDMESFANKSGSRLFVPLSLFRPSFVSIKSSERKQSIVIPGGILRIDTLYMQIPLNYIPESIPQSINFSNDFGDYSRDINKLDDNNKYMVTQRFLLKQGHYDANRSENFLQFFKNVEKESSKQAIFKHN